MDPERAVVYVRISEDRAGDAAGVGRQEADARSLAERMGWGVGEVIVENDVSAFKRRTVTLPDGSRAKRVVRPGFRRLLDLLTNRIADGMVAYDLDRVARDPRDLEDLIDAVETTGSPVASVTGSLRLANDSDITMARVMVAVANKSSRDSSRRIRRKHEELAAAGRPAGGVRRFGFEADGITHRPEEVEVVRWAAQRILEGAAIATVARELQDKGIPTVRGGRWADRSLRGILTGPRVAGLRVHRGDVVRDAVWEPILDRETWEAVCATIAGRSTHTRPDLKRWLTGLLLCGRCGQPMIGAYVKPQSYRYWCSTRLGGCGIAINGPGVEGEIARQVRDYLTQPALIDRLAGTTTAAGAERARREMAEDEAQLRELSRMWAEKRITLPEYAEARAIITQRIEASRRLLMQVIPSPVRRAVEAEDIGAAWDELDPTTRRELVRLLVGGWRVMPADLTKPRRFDPTRLKVILHDDTRRA